MFAVIGHAVGYLNMEGADAKPYLGPVADTKEGAVDRWAKKQIQDGEIPAEIERSANNLKQAEVNTVVKQYDGDEHLIVVQIAA